jgi:transcriptional regulator
LTFDKTGLTVPVEHHRKGDAVSAARTDVLQGTLDLLILKALSLEPMHGWAVAQRINQISKSALQVNQGSLYPALHRLEYRGWISAQWGASENNRKAKYYRLTALGRKQLGLELEQWRRFALGVELVIAAEPGNPAGA